MSFTPFTFDEATEICEDFEDLRDTEFTMNGVEYLVDDVLVCPHPEADKQTFIEQYMRSKDGEAALGAYTGSDFDVVLFISDADNEADVLHMNIRSYTAERGVAYNFPA